MIEIGAAAAGHRIHQQHAERTAVAVVAGHGQHGELPFGDRLALAQQVGNAWATMRESAATATFCTTHAVETVAPDTGVGQRALQIFVPAP